MSKSILIKETDILQRVETIAASRAEAHHQNHPGEGLLMIAILKGAAMFAADLQRALWRQGLQNTQIEYFQISSYGQKLSSSGKPTMLGDEVALAEKVRGKHVMVVEDIIETGHTLADFLKLLGEMGALSVVVVVLIAKGGAQLREVKVDEVGFTLGPKDWIDGYGIDTGEEGRGNPDIMLVSEETASDAA